MMDLPIGAIVMFDGSSPPPGWYDCDGGTYAGITTPNLIGAFPRGVPAGGNLGASGGTATHNHGNQNTGTATHGHGAASTNSGTTTQRVGGIWGGSTFTVVEDHQHLITAAALTNQANHFHTMPATSAASSMPPYIRLRYIMRCE